MHYQVFARKWRPQKFSEIIGQQYVIKAIVNSFLLKKIHHAYLFIGVRGTGKTTIARLFAKGLNCKQSIKSAVVCGECKNCKDIELGCFIDLIEIDAASRTKVEETREFLDNIQYVPSIGRFKIYLIDEIHMLSKHSFNALLKALEEPPVHVKFFLVTTEYRKIPETILSRCLQFYLKPLNIVQIKTQLIHVCKIENVIIEEISALESLAHAAKGSMRDALNLLEQAIVLGEKKINFDVINNMFGIINIEHPLYLIENLIDGNIHNILSQINDYAILGINWDYLLAEMLIILKKISINQFLNHSIITPKEDNKIQIVDKRIYELSHRITPENVQLYYQILLLGRRELPYAPSYKMGVEMTMLRVLALKSIPSNTVETHNNNKKNIISFDGNKKKLNVNIANNVKINEKKFPILIKEKNVKKSSCIKNKFLHVEEECNNKYDINDVTSHDIIPLSVEDIISDTTKKLLTARLTLLKQKRQHDKLKNKSDFITNVQQKTTENILKRFSNINHVISKNKNITYITTIGGDNTNYTKSNCVQSINDVREDHEKNIPIFIKEILQQAIKNSPWMLQIYRLSLPKLAKKITMNSWKEEISKNKICLHVRPDCYVLSSVELKYIIQAELSKDIGNVITLYIKQDNNFAIKTPMEHIHTLYQKKVSNKKKEFLKDPYIQMIQNMFDAEYDDNDIQML